MLNYDQLPEGSIYDACVLTAKGINGTIDTKENFSMIKSVGFWYNRYFFNEMGEDAFRKSLIYVKENLAKGCPFALQYTENDSTSNFEKILNEEGFFVLTHQAGMNLDLSKEFPTFDASKIRIMTKEDVKKWANTVAMAFGKPYEDECYTAMMEADMGAIFYGYEENGKIIGTCMGYVHDENAGVHEVSVLPKYRGQKIAKNMLLKLLADAKTKGAKYASLQATPLGEPLYKALGFEYVNTMTTALVKKD